ncbi:unnamed protein product [Cylicocyclus nassatus]|uniref:Uncharacterized protein n=1 Tax=Cylicocyclus nassatus TaxID=53992 RepID=A0AA36GZV2_CYLNA|nr:unnamed protein product [Cylicocyclus nassatus]
MRQLGEFIVVLLIAANDAAAPRRDKRQIGQCQCAQPYVAMQSACASPYQSLLSPVLSAPVPVAYYQSQQPAAPPPQQLVPQPLPIQQVSHPAYPYPPPPQEVPGPHPGQPIPPPEEQGPHPLPLPQEGQPLPPYLQPPPMPPTFQPVTPRVDQSVTDVATSPTTSNTRLFDGPQIAYPGDFCQVPQTNVCICRRGEEPVNGQCERVEIPLMTETPGAPATLTPISSTTPLPQSSSTSPTTTTTTSSTTIPLPSSSVFTDTTRMASTVVTTVPTSTPSQQIASTPVMGREDIPLIRNKAEDQAVLTVLDEQSVARDDDGKSSYTKTLIMELEPSNSSISWSDYSITEDDAYVYCRVGAGGTQSENREDTIWRDQSPQPTFEDWVRASRDSGFAEKMLSNEHTYSDAERNDDDEEDEDHDYYNLLFRKTETEHDYTYPAFNQKENEEKTEDEKMAQLKAKAARRFQAKFRRDDSRLSVISARTVINGARPYRPATRTPSTIERSSVVRPIYKNRLGKKMCCVECRDEELEQLNLPKTHTYENVLGVSRENDTIELYGRLLMTAMLELRTAPGGMQRTAALQRKIEKILRLHTTIDLTKTSDDFETAIKQFEHLVERRLRAINDISPSCYQKIADKLCATQSAARRQKTMSVRLAAIRKGIQKVFRI